MRDMVQALAQRLEGRRVVLEPLEARHEEGLWAAAQEPRIWTWMSVLAGSSREAFHDWFEEALASRRAGEAVPFATLDAGSGSPVGSTRYLAVRPEHRVVEIGWTWLAPSRWSSGANVEAKYLMLRHAFELGFLRVEFKTDALNERSRGALAALPAEFEGIHRRHMLVRGGERRDSAWYAVIDEDWPRVKAALERRLDRSG
jgi:N-acetyltransferase